MKIGSYEWARRTGGRLSWWQQLSQVGQVIAVTVKELPDRFGLRRRERLQQGWESVKIPDSRVARLAEEQVRECSGPGLYHHTLRTYAWGALIGNAEKVNYDPELFYVACLLHDLGLTQAYSFQLPQTHCFAVEGAFHAEALLRELEFPQARKVAEAISFHLNARVTVADGAEAYLLRTGSALDTAGARYAQIHRQDRKQVLQRYPRHHLKRELLDCLDYQSRHRRGDRLQALRRAGFTLAVKAAPFKE